MRRLTFGLALAASVLAIGLGAAGCKGDGGKPGVASVGTATSPAASAAPAPGDYRAFAQCMRSNGVPDFPDPGPDPDRPFEGAIEGLDRAALVRAMQACGSVAPFADRVTQEMGDNAEKWRPVAECMRQAGLDVADPDPNDSFLDWAQTFPTDSPRFREIAQDCVEKAGINLGDRGGQ